MKDFHQNLKSLRILSNFRGVLFSISLIICIGFTENVHEYFKKANFEQRRRILEIISDGITYKDGELNIKLKPVFQSIVENQYISAQKMSNNRNAETGIIKGVEIPSTPLNEKFSPGWTRTSNPSINSRMLRH